MFWGKVLVCEKIAVHNWLRIDLRLKGIVSHILKSKNE